MTRKPTTQGLQGLSVAVQRLKRRNSNVIVGGNIGKNKVTPNDLAFQDYEKCFEALFDHVIHLLV